MIPVMQTKMHDPPHSFGNCMWASIASITDIPLDEFPEIFDVDGDSITADGKTWGTAMRQTLDRYGFEYMGCQPYERACELSSGVDGYFVVGGESPRGGCGHAVVFKNGKMVHDPHPDGTGINTIEEAYMIERT